LFVGIGIKKISHFFDTAKRNYQTAYPNGKANTRAFTARNQLSSVAYDGNLMANFQYDLGMREISRGLGNGLTQATSYRPDNTILQKSVAGITNYSYTYNANKVKLSETDGTMSSLSQTFSYDFENRLTSWTSNGTTLNQNQSWNLSLEGAWLANTVNGVTENRTFNQAYETLTSNSNAMTHDQKGNLTQNKDGSLYTWDFDNQLAFSNAGTPTVNASYSYDALGRRVSKSSGNTITVFVHSDYQILTEYKSINGGSFTETQSFVYATYLDDPIVIINTNGTYFYHSNQQFSIGAITDSNGNLSERYGYNAYGKPVVIADSILVDNPYFFTGRQLDSETGLFYFRARNYDANLGQFISRDPIGYVDGMSLYRGYFAVNGVDAFGLDFSDQTNSPTVPPANIVPGHIITMVMDRAPAHTYEHFRQLPESQRGHLINNRTGAQDIADTAARWVKKKGKCISTLTLASHGSSFVGVDSSVSPKFEQGTAGGANFYMPASIVASITASICPDGVINICACLPDNLNTEIAGQALADLLKRKVCFCRGAVNNGCNCTTGKWLCKTPKKV